MSALPKTIGPAVSIGNVAVVNAPELEQFQAFQGEIDYNFRHLSELHQKEVLKMIYQRLERITDLDDGRSLFFMRPGPKAEEVWVNYPYLHLEIDDTLYEVFGIAVHQHGHGGLYPVLFDSLLQAFPARLVMRIMHEQRLEWPDETTDLVMPAITPGIFQFHEEPVTQEGE